MIVKWGVGFRHADNRRKAHAGQGRGKVGDFRAVAGRLLGINDDVVEVEVGIDLCPARVTAEKRHRTDDLPALVQGLTEISAVHIG